MPLTVLTAESTGLFIGPADAPLQLVRVRVTGATQPTPIHVSGTDERVAGKLVVLAPGYEHPGDPRQPDNTHTH